MPEIPEVERNKDLENLNAEGNANDEEADSKLGIKSMLKNEQAAHKVNKQEDKEMKLREKIHKNASAFRDTGYRCCHHKNEKIPTPTNTNTRSNLNDDYITEQEEKELNELKNMVK